jgi:hypothetical protein
MSYRGKLDEPGYIESILEEIRNRPREYWLEKLARYENEKPGDIVLPGVPLDRIKKTSTADAPKKPARKNKKAA